MFVFDTRAEQRDTDEEREREAENLFNQETFLFGKGYSHRTTESYLIS